MRIITVNLIVEKGGKILIVKRADTQSEADLWSLPGGTVKLKEPLKQALAREIKEELNCLTNNLKLYDIIYNDNEVISYYYTGILKGKIKLNQENSEYKWVKIKNLPKMAYDQHKLFNELSTDCLLI